jgi:hypothetical protein
MRGIDKSLRVLIDLLLGLEDPALQPEQKEKALKAARSLQHGVHTRNMKDVESAITKLVRIFVR